MSSFQKEFVHGFVDEMNKIASATKSLAAMGAAVGGLQSLKSRPNDNDTTGQKVDRALVNTAIGGATGAAVGHYGEKTVKHLSREAGRHSAEAMKEGMRGAAWTSLDPRPALKKLLRLKK